MSDETTIKYLTYFIEFLDDTVFKDLISLIFNKEHFVIKPFDSYKDFFIYLLDADKYKITYKKEISYQDLINAKNEVVESLKKDGAKKEKNYSIKNEYYLLKSELKGKRIIDKTDVDSNDIADLLNYYNDKFIPTAEARSLILRYVSYIGYTIMPFFLLGYKNRTEFKHFLNHIINKIINERYCIGTYLSSDGNTLYKISKTIVCQTENENRIITKYYYINKLDKQIFLTDYDDIVRVPFPEFLNLISKDINVKSYNKLSKTVNKKINEFNKKTKKRRFCHICNPYDEQNVYRKDHKCESCKMIYSLIMEIEPKLTTNDIGGKIKRRYIDEHELSNKNKKDRHYKNLKEFVKKLENRKIREDILTNVNKNKNTDLKNKFIELNELIDKTFGKD